MGRWEKLKVVSPQKLEMARAKSASKETVDAYFTELGNLMREHDLLTAPERIYNIDESGSSTEHTPPKIICDKTTKPQSVTSPRSKNVTIIGGANAIGNHVPPFYIFPGKRWNDSLLDGAVAGAAGGMSESGWVNRGLFEEYIINHFARHVGLDRGDRPTTLILYDGHKSHLSLTLTQWAKDHRVILFVLPPHSSHLTQPLDVGVFGPMKKFFYQECKLYMHANPGVSITRYEVAKLTNKPFSKAFSPINIISAFKKSGIYPFDSEKISEKQTAPATIYNTEPVHDVEEDQDVITYPLADTSAVTSTTEQQSFLQSKTITKVVQRPKKKFTPPVKVTGNLLSETNIEVLQGQSDKKQQKCEQILIQSVKKQDNKTNKPQPSTSGLSKRGAPLSVEDTSSEDDSDDDEDLCCVCESRFPPQLRGYPSLVIIKWGKCDLCEHWVHLTYCSKVRVLRRDSSFRCTHCQNE